MLSLIKTQLHFHADQFCLSRVLRVSLMETVTSEGIATLGRLENLQEFLYAQFDHRSTNEEARNHKFFAICLQVLPRLWVSCSRTRIYLISNKSNIHLRHFTDYNYAAVAFQQLRGKLPSRLGLRQLTLLTTTGMPVGVALPDLKTLAVISPQDSFRLGSGLESLTELGLHDIKQKRFEQILEQIGHQLLKLSVSVLDTLLVDRVFRMCPNLQNFHVSDFPGDFVGVETTVPTMSCLTELVFNKMLDTWDNLEWALFEAEHFLQILRALPNLRIFKLLNFSFEDQAEAEGIVKALEQHLILQQLESLVFNFQWQIILEDSNRENCVRWTSLVLRSMVRHCPKLNSFRRENCQDLKIILL